MKQFLRGTYGIPTVLLVFSLLVLTMAVVVRQYQEKGRSENFQVATSWVDGQDLEASATCATGTSPEIQVKNVPQGTKHFALYLRSENDGTDWLVSGIPSEIKLLPAGTKPEGTTYRNQKGNFSYVAPCKAGKYTLSIFALGEDFPDLNSGTDPDLVLANLNRLKLAQHSITVSVR
ncbi:hypothetical protein BH11PAT4_BH11PAT4_7050 [soil metagenome]